MNYKQINNSIIVFFKENSYAEPIADYNGLTPVVLADFMQPAITKTERVELKRTTQSRQPIAENVLQGRTSAELTFKGSLSDGHSILFKAFCGNSAFPITINDTSELPSYEIHQLFNDGTVNIAKGCVCSSLEITGESGDGINYEASFRCQWEDKEISCAGLTNYPSFTSLYNLLTNYKPFSFADTSVVELLGQNLDSYKSFNSFELKLENTFADDAVLFANSHQKNTEITTAMKGEFKAEMNYNPNLKIDSTRLVTTDKGTAVFKLKAFGVYWTVNIKGILAEATYPNSDKDIYKLAATIALARHDRFGNCLTISRTTM